MKERWHEQIQRCVAGASTRQETAALQQALKTDAGLRELYLDYLNLEVALDAAAEAAAIAGNDRRWLASARPHSRAGLGYAATAVCMALVVMTMLHAHRGAPGVPQDFGIHSAENAVARLSFEQPSSFPAWMSPTASMLSVSLSPE
jgi:hypothetical protein